MLPSISVENVEKKIIHLKSEKTCPRPGKLTENKYSLIDYIMLELALITSVEI